MAPRNRTLRSRSTGRLVLHRILVYFGLADDQRDGRQSRSGSGISGDLYRELEDLRLRVEELERRL